MQNKYQEEISEVSDHLYMFRECRFVSQGELVALLLSRGGLLPAAHRDVLVVGKEQRKLNRNRCK